MKKFTVTVLLALAATCLGLGQATSGQRKPGPDHQKLAGFVGNWTTEGEAAESPFGPAEKLSGKITCEWFSGQFAVVCHVEGKGSVSGEIRRLQVISFRLRTKTYSWYGIDNRGGTWFPTTAISGDVLTALLEFQANGKTYKVRGTLKGLGSDRNTWVEEYSEDGKVWKAYFHDTATRLKSR